MVEVFDVIVFDNPLSSALRDEYGRLSLGSSIVFQNQIVNSNAKLLLNLLKLLLAEKTRWILGTIALLAKQSQQLVFLDCLDVKVGGWARLGNPHLLQSLFYIRRTCISREQNVKDIVQRNVAGVATRVRVKEV